MRKLRAKLDKGGRLVIPSAYRKALGLRPGDEVVIRLEDDELRISSVRGALARARRMIRRYIPAGKNLTRSLIKDRRREAARE